MEIRRQPIRNSQGDKICFKMCLSKHFCRSASTKRKQHLIRYICKSIQTKKSKMTSYQPPEPPPVFETVSLGKMDLHSVANVILTYDTKSRNYDVIYGTFKNKESKGGSTKLTILSDSNHQYTVTRKRGGEYETNHRNWMEVVKT